MTKGASPQPLPEDWRQILLHRLLGTVVPLFVGALLLTLLGTSGDNRRTLLVLVAFVPPMLAARLRPRWPYRLRAALLIIPLVAAVFLAYALAGFTANGSVLAAASVVLAGLLFGRGTAVATLGVLLLAPLLAGGGMLLGLLPSEPRPDLSLTSPVAWARTTMVSLAAWTMLGLAVTFVVEHVEAARGRAEHALEELREQVQRREAAEAARKQAQEAAAQAQKMELAARLAAGTAHDFNNLLGVLGGWAELALGGGVTGEEEEQARAAVGGALQQGRALTRQLAALARQDSRNVVELALDGTVRAAVQMLQRVLPRSMKLELVVAGAARVQADETELQQVLFNLVLNARDAMPEGGSVVVRVSVLETSGPLPVVGGSLPAGRWASLAVKDAGVGIDPETKARLFELFFTTKPVGAGTGLGLATVLRIAQSSGGGVTVESELGRGSTFTLYFPIAGAAPSVSNRRMDVV